MNAKDYIKRIRDIDEEIESVCEDIQGKEERAMRVTSAISRHVIPSYTKQRMADVIGEYVDIERGRLKDLMNERQEIIDTIRLLPSKEYGVLFRRYVLMCEFYEIGAAYDRSESWAKSKMRTALDSLQQILDEREKL